MYDLMSIILMILKVMTNNKTLKKKKDSKPSLVYTGDCYAMGIKDVTLLNNLKNL